MSRVLELIHIVYNYLEKAVRAYNWLGHVRPSISLSFPNLTNLLQLEFLGLKILDVKGQGRRVRYSKFYDSGYNIFQHRMNGYLPNLHNSILAHEIPGLIRFLEVKRQGHGVVHRKPLCTDLYAQPSVRAYCTS